LSAFTRINIEGKSKDYEIGHRSMIIPDLTSKRRKLT